MDLYDIFQGQLTDQKWKRLGEYLKGREIHAGRGIVLEDSSSSGTIISAEQVRQIPPTQAPPFSVLAVRRVPESNPVEYKIQMQEGWVIDRYTDDSSNAVQFHEVNLDGVAMSTRPRREITVLANEIVYVQYTTTNEGYINNTPSISKSTSEPFSTHHAPPSGEGSGSAGTYYVKLFKLVIEDNGPKIIVYQQSDVEHSRLPTFRNLGGERYIHKQWSEDDDRYDFRTLKQIEPTSGITYGKVIVDATGNEIDAVNDTIKFSAIAQKPDSDDPQVKVSDNGSGIITIKGNNNDATIRFMDCNSPQVAVGTLIFKDGLLTTASTDINVGECNDSGSGGSP